MILTDKPYILNPNNKFKTTLAAMPSSKQVFQDGAKIVAQVMKFSLPSSVPLTLNHRSSTIKC